MRTMAITANSITSVPVKGSDDEVDEEGGVTDTACTTGLGGCTGTEVGATHPT